MHRQSCRLRRHMLLRWSGCWRLHASAGQASLRAAASQHTLSPPLLRQRSMQTQRYIVQWLAVALPVHSNRIFHGSSLRRNAWTACHSLLIRTFVILKLQDLRASHAALAAADLEADFANSVPAWSPLLDAMAAATASSTPAVQSRVTALQQQQQQQLMPSADDAGTSSVVLQGVDAVVEQVLLWGQTVAAAQSAWAAPPAEGVHCAAPHAYAHGCTSKGVIAILFSPCLRMFV